MNVLDAMKQALEAVPANDYRVRDRLRAVIAECEKTKPIGYFADIGNGYYEQVLSVYKDGANVVPLYAHHAPAAPENAEPIVPPIFIHADVKVTNVEYRDGTLHILCDNTYVSLNVAELKQQRDELVAALLEISQIACSLSPEQKIANEALARIGKGGRQT